MTAAVVLRLVGDLLPPHTMPCEAAGCHRDAEWDCAVLYELADAEPEVDADGVVGPHQRGEGLIMDAISEAQAKLEEIAKGTQQ
jgi:hypothetical protein